MDGDQIVNAAQQYVQKFGIKRHGPEIQAMMDAVADIEGYRLDPSSPQGYIRRKFLSERIEANHVVDFDMLVSKFWSGVFQYLMKASKVGGDVEVREQTLLQNAEIGVAEVEVTHHHGRAYKVRATKMPAITFLRMQGVAAARKYVNECYKRRLRQQCQDCGRVASLGSTKEFDEGCKCGSMKSEIIARVMRRRERRCLDCKELRPANIKRLCGHENEDGTFTNGCGSTDVSVVQAEEFIPDDSDRQEALHDTHEEDSETKFIEHELERDGREFIAECVKSMPGDPNNPSGDSQSRKILRVLVDPQAGAEVCRSCNDRAAKVCVECKEADCAHEKVPDPKMCCGSNVFSIGQCVNYSKRIGEHFGYTASLANRRVAKVREFVAKFAKEHAREFVSARVIAESVK